MDFFYYIEGIFHSGLFYFHNILQEFRYHNFYEKYILWEEIGYLLRVNNLLIAIILYDLKLF